MDKHPSIDELFAKARQQAPVASLDETKEAFLKAVGTPAVKSKLFTSKKWLMYLSVTTLVIGLLAGSVFLSKTEKTRHTLKNHPTQNTVAPASAQPKPAAEKRSEQPLTKYSAVKTLPEDSPLQEWKALLETPIISVSSGIPNHPVGKDTIRPLEDEYQLPKLTDEEIAATEKQKKSMLKALQKRDNNREHYAYLPSGTFQYQDKTVSLQAFFMQTTEVSNLEYRTFLFDLLIQGRKDEFLKAKPDQHMWVKQFDGGMKVMEDMYFWHPAYNDYPVVNVSREGAELYCKWLTQSFNEYAEKKKISPINDIRLPARSEWTYAASSCGKYTNYPWAGEFVRNSKGLFLANHHPDNGRYTDDGIFHTGLVKSYNPNDYGLYCMSGNVAEMVYNTDNSRANPGTAGGDWTSDSEHIKIGAEDPYSGITEARCTIGFRIVFTHLGRL